MVCGLCDLETVHQIMSERDSLRMQLQGAIGNLNQERGRLNVLARALGHATADDLLSFSGMGGRKWPEHDRELLPTERALLGG